jgi:hypothetical protein
MAALSLGPRWRSVLSANVTHDRFAEALPKFRERDYREIARHGHYFRCRTVASISVVPARTIVIYLDLDGQYEPQSVRQDHTGFLISGESGYA